MEKKTVGEAGEEEGCEGSQVISNLSMDNLFRLHIAGSQLSFVPSSSLKSHSHLFRHQNSVRCHFDCLLATQRSGLVSEGRPAALIWQG